MLKPLLLNVWAVVAGPGEMKSNVIVNPTGRHLSLGSSITAPVDDDWEVFVEVRRRVPSP